MTIALSIARMRMRRALRHAKLRRLQRRATQRLALYAAREARKAALQSKYGIRW